MLRNAQAQTITASSLITILINFSLAPDDYARRLGEEPDPRDGANRSGSGRRIGQRRPYPLRALPSYMNVIGLEPRIYPLSSRSMRNLAFSISCSIARFR